MIKSINFMTKSIKITENAQFQACAASLPGMIVSGSTAIHSLEGTRERLGIAETTLSGYLRHWHLAIGGEQVRGTLHLYCRDEHFRRLAGDFGHAAAKRLLAHVKPLRNLRHTDFAQ